MQRGNESNPAKAYAVRDKRSKRVYYETSQLSKKRCGCRTSFGGDSDHNSVSVDSQQFKAGTRYEKVLMDVIRQNTADQPETVYAQKAYHALLNVNHHKQQHCIDPHSDVQPDSTYVRSDPITSCSWGCAGVLVLSVAPKTGYKSVTKKTMLVARDGDVAIMGGDFQRRFLHEVPPVPQWKNLQESLSADLQPWEIEVIDREAALFDAGYPDVSDTRYNSTIRWHTNHHHDCFWNPNKCSARPESSAPTQQATVDTSPAPSVAETRAQFGRFHFASGAFKLGTGNPAFKLGTGPAPTIAASSHAVSETGVSSDTPAPPCQDVVAQTDLSGDLVSMALVRANLQLLQKMFANVAFLPAAFANWSFMGSGVQCQTEMSSLSDMAEFVENMTQSLRDAGQMVRQLPDESTSDNWCDSLQIPTDTLHRLQIMVKDRFLLNACVETLRSSYHLTFHELVCDNMTSHIQNQSHLTKVMISHKHFLGLMRRIDVEWLRCERSMIMEVESTTRELRCWKKPDTHQLVNKEHGNHGMGTFQVPHHGQVHVAFVDVGHSAESTTRRVHLRAVGRVVDQRFGRMFADQVYDAMERAMAHVRMLDCHSEGSIHPEAQTAEEGYDVAIWLCDVEKVNAYRTKQADKVQKHKDFQRSQSSGSQPDDTGHAHSWHEDRRHDGSWSQGNWKRGKWREP